VIAARHLGIEVLGLSCVTNMAAGVLDRPIDHADVMEIGARVEQQLARLLGALVPLLRTI
jgi:purine-nucleoside phosphorylase